MTSGHSAGLAVSAGYEDEWGAVPSTEGSTNSSEEEEEESSKAA